MAGRAAGFALALVVLTAAVVGRGGDAGASDAPARVIDRTFRCTPVELSDELRAVAFDAVPIGANEPYLRTQPKSPGFIGVASGGWGPDSELVSIRARGWQRFATVFSDEGVYASTRRCTPARVSVPLSPRGVPGPPVRSAMHETCLIRGRVLVRLRATLQSPATWGSQPRSAFAGARRNVVEAAIAARSEDGRPLAYLELARGGTTRLWYSAACTG